MPTTYNITIELHYLADTYLTEDYIIEYIWFSMGCSIDTLRRYLLKAKELGQKENAMSVLGAVRFLKHVPLVAYGMYVEEYTRANSMGR